MHDSAYSAYKSNTMLINVTSSPVHIAHAIQPEQFAYLYAIYTACALVCILLAVDAVYTLVCIDYLFS